MVVKIMKVVSVVTFVTSLYLLPVAAGSVSRSQSVVTARTNLSMQIRKRSPVTPVVIAGASNDLWLLGTHSCTTGICKELMRSTDGGESFEWVSSPPSSVTSIHFANREDGYAYDDNQSTVDSTPLYWTRDGGKVWHLALQRFLRWPSGVVTTDGRAYVLVRRDCSTYNCRYLDLATSLTSRNAWTSTPLPIDAATHLISVAAHGLNVWIIATSDGGSNAQLLVSRNGGKSFSDQSITGMNGLGCEANATSATTLWGFCATGMLGYPARSTDGGQHFVLLRGWKRSAANSGLVSPLSDELAVFQPGGNLFYVTRDGGEHLTSVRFSSPRSSPIDFFTVAFANRTKWLVLGFQGPGVRMWRTPNAGRSWRLVKDPVT